jgi:hypothetical protein
VGGLRGPILVGLSEEVSWDSGWCSDEVLDG